MRLAPVVPKKLLVNLMSAGSDSVEVYVVLTLTGYRKLLNTPALDV